MKAIKYLGLTLMLGACTSPQPKDYYEIVGEVKNVEDSTIINLFRQDGKVGRSIATDTIIGGKFHFKIKPDSLVKDELTLGCFQSKQIPTLMLTSNPKRVAANKLYQAMGFERKETNVYRMKF